MIKKSFYDWLVEKLIVTLPDVSISDIEDTPIAAIGLDSLELLDLVMEIEDFYKIELAIDDLDRNITVASIKELIERSSSGKF